MSDTMYPFETGVINLSDLQKYLKDGGIQPVFVYKHKLHDIICIRQDNDETWYMLAVNEQRMSRMFRIDSGLNYDGKFFRMNDSKDR